MISERTLARQTVAADLWAACFADDTMAAKSLFIEVPRDNIPVSRHGSVSRNQPAVGGVPRLVHSEVGRKQHGPSTRTRLRCRRRTLCLRPRADGRTGVDRRTGSVGPERTRVRPSGTAGGPRRCGAWPSLGRSTKSSSIRMKWRRISSSTWWCENPASGRACWPWWNC